MQKLRVAIIGQGRSGKDIHGVYFLSERNKYYDVKFVVERNAIRRKISKDLYAGCTVLEEYTQLFAYKNQIDVVINTSYSQEHFEVTKDLLAHGFNVLTEKPLCRNAYETDVLMETAKKYGAKLAVFHNTLYAPYYNFTKDLMTNGKLGEILQVRVKFSTLARRWDWQTLQKKMAGNAYNTGPHPIGLALGLVDYDKNSKIVYSKLATTSMSSGDADDFVKIIIDTPNKALLDIEINNTDAYSDFNVKLIGSKGTFQSTIASYKMKYVVDGENAARPLQEDFLRDEDYNPIYCTETLVAHEEEGKYDGTPFDAGTSNLYEDMYYYITENRTMKFTPVEAKAVVGVIDAIHALNPLEKKF